MTERVPRGANRKLIRNRLAIEAEAARLRAEADQASTGDDGPPSPAMLDLLVTMMALGDCNPPIVQGRIDEALESLGDHERPDMAQAFLHAVAGLTGGVATTAKTLLDVRAGTYPRGYMNAALAAYAGHCAAIGCPPCAPLLRSLDHVHPDAARDLLASWIVAVMAP